MGTAGLRVVVVDDHPVIQEGIGDFFEFADDIEVVGAAPDAAQASDLIADVNPDVVLVDLALPGMDGADFAAQLKVTHPKIRVLIFTAMFDPVRLRFALASGADGVVSKTASPARLIEAVRAVARGERALDPGVEHDVNELLPVHLSPRELDVLRCMADGLTNKELALRLFIADATAKKHVENIRRKLGATDRARAVAEGFRRGLLR